MSAADCPFPKSDEYADEACPICEQLDKVEAERDILKAEHEEEFQKRRVAERCLELRELTIKVAQARIKKLEILVESKCEECVRTGKAEIHATGTLIQCPKCKGEE